MSGNASPFLEKKNFEEEYFFYFLPLYNLEQKQKIGEKIQHFKGVNISILIFIKLTYIFFSKIYKIINKYS